MKEFEKAWVQGRSLRCNPDIASKGGCRWTHEVNSVITQPVPTEGGGGRGNIRIQSQKEQRYRCSTCGQTFAATKGTPFYRLRGETDVVTLVLTLLCQGCPLQASVVAFRFDERTVARWQARAGHHCQPVHEHLVSPGGVELGHVQTDELGVKRVGRGVWMAMALAVPSRLGLGGVVSPYRDRALSRRLVSMVHACAGSLAILVGVDGLRAYVTACLRVFRHPVRAGRRGRPRLGVEPDLLLGQVIKR